MSKFISRIGADKKKFETEVTIHYLKFDKPSKYLLKFRIKRGKNKTEETQSYQYTPLLKQLQINYTFSFTTSLFQKNNKFSKKDVQIKILEIQGKTEKQLSSIPLDIHIVAEKKKPLEFEEFQLKELKGKICISAKLFEQSDKRRKSISSVSTDSIQTVRRAFSVDQSEGSKIRDELEKEPVVFKEEQSRAKEKIKEEKGKRVLNRSAFCVPGEGEKTEAKLKKDPKKPQEIGKNLKKSCFDIGPDIGLSDDSGEEDNFHGGKSRPKQEKKDFSESQENIRNSARNLKKSCFNLGNDPDFGLSDDSDEEKGRSLYAEKTEVKRKTEDFIEDQISTGEGKRDLKKSCFDIGTDRDFGLSEESGEEKIEPTGNKKEENWLSGGMERELGCEDKEEDLGMIESLEGNNKRAESIIVERNEEDKELGSRYKESKGDTEDSKKGDKEIEIYLSEMKNHENKSPEKGMSEGDSDKESSLSEIGNNEELGKKERIGVGRDSESSLSEIENNEEVEQKEEVNKGKESESSLSEIDKADERVLTEGCENNEEIENILKEQVNKEAQGNYLENPLVEVELIQSNFENEDSLEEKDVKNQPTEGLINDKKGFMSEDSLEDEDIKNHKIKAEFDEKNIIKSEDTLQEEIKSQLNQGKVNDKSFIDEDSLEDSEIRNQLVKIPVSDVDDKQNKEEIQNELVENIEKKIESFSSDSRDDDSLNKEKNNENLEELILTEHKETRNFFNEEKREVSLVEDSIEENQDDICLDKEVGKENNSFISQDSEYKDKENENRLSGALNESKSSEEMDPMILEKAQHSLPPVSDQHINEMLESSSESIDEKTLNIKKEKTESSDYKQSNNPLKTLENSEYFLRDSLEFPESLSYKHFEKESNPGLEIPPDQSDEINSPQIDLLKSSKNEEIESIDLQQVPIILQQTSEPHSSSSDDERSSSLKSSPNEVPRKTSSVSQESDLFEKEYSGSSSSSDQGIPETNIDIHGPVCDMKDAEPNAASQEHRLNLKEKEAGLPESRNTSCCGRCLIF